jgi:glycosyltransferase involved in cell wall biosynthesis
VTTSPSEATGRRPRILSFTTVYPNPIDPGRGQFVRSRLQHLAQFAEVKVMAPVAALDYGGAKSGKFFGANVPYHREDGNIEVLHPRWLYPPMGGSMNGMCLFAMTVNTARRLRREFAFDVIDAHFAHPDGVAASLIAASLGCPYTVTLRGNETMHAEHPLRRYWIRKALTGAARVITVSERLRQFAISLGVRPERTKTIPNGIETSVFFERDRIACRKRFEMPPDRKIILSVGYLIERKGHHRAVRSLKVLLDQGCPCELWIVGGKGREGDYEQEIRRLVKDLNIEGYVRFQGPVPSKELPDYMSAADVLCLATTREGWPNVVHEALGCGTPVVVTDVGGVPDLVPSSDFGFIVPVNDQNALDEALAKAVRIPWNRGAIAAWGQSRSWRHVAAEVAGEFRQVIAERN